MLPLTVEKLRFEIAVLTNFDGRTRAKVATPVRLARGRPITSIWQIPPGRHRLEISHAIRHPRLRSGDPPIDLTALLAVFMGISIVLIPVLGITARFALKPTVEALSRFFDKKGSDEAVSILERRMALIKQQVESIDTNVQRLVETAEFDRNLATPTQSPAQISGPSSDE